MKIKTVKKMTYYTVLGPILIRKGSVLEADIDTRLAGRAYYRFKKMGEDFYCPLGYAAPVEK